MIRKTGRRVLIVRQDRLGDCVTATPLPRELKRAWPDADVGMLVRRANAPVYAANPHVDEILHVEDVLAPGPAALARGVARLRAGRWSHALMLLPWSRVGWATFWAGIPNRIGIGHALHHVLTFAKVRHRRMDEVRQHEIDHSLDFLRFVGIEPADDRPEIHLTDDERARAAALRERLLDGRRRLVGIHAGSGGSAPNWPAADYVELAQRLADDARVRVVLTDPEAPAALLAVPDAVRLYADPAHADLRTGIVAFSALDALVSSSTGPMHVCAALGTPTVSLFCPLPACAPSLWGPRGNGGRVVLPEAAYCRDRCPGDPHDCSYADGGIPVERMLDAVADVLG